MLHECTVVMGWSHNQYKSVDSTLTNKRLIIAEELLHDEGEVDLRKEEVRVKIETQPRDI